MADIRSGEPHHAISRKSALYGSVAGIAVGGPLLGMMGLSFMPPMTLLVISSPVLLIFSPVLLSAAFVIACAVAGFSVFAAVAVVGVATLRWVFQQLGLGVNLTRFFRTQKEETSTSVAVDIHHYKGAEPNHAISRKSALYGSVAGITVGGPLLGMMGFSFMAAMALLLISSPVLLIFSPLLLSAVFVLACAVAGFSVFVAVVVVGVAALGWVFEQLGFGVKRTRLLGLDGAVDKLADGGGVAME